MARGEWSWAFIWLRMAGRVLCGRPGALWPALSRGGVVSAPGGALCCGLAGAVARREKATGRGRGRGGERHLKGGQVPRASVAVGDSQVELNGDRARAVRKHVACVSPLPPPVPFSSPLSSPSSRLLPSVPRPALLLRARSAHSAHNASCGELPLVHPQGCMAAHQDHEHARPFARRRLPKPPPRREAWHRWFPSRRPQDGSLQEAPKD